MLHQNASKIYLDCYWQYLTYTQIYCKSNSYIMYSKLYLVLCMNCASIKRTIAYFLQFFLMHNKILFVHLICIWKDRCLLLDVHRGNTINNAWSQKWDCYWQLTIDQIYFFVMSRKTLVSWWKLHEYRFNTLHRSSSLLLYSCFINMKRTWLAFRFQ